MLENIQHESAPIIGPALPPPGGQEADTQQRHVCTMEGDGATLGLRTLPEVTPVDPATLQPHIGEHGRRFLEEIRRGEGAIADGKLVVDALLGRLGPDMEAHLARGYGQGLTAADIYRGAVGDLTAYTSARPPLQPAEGEETLPFALRLRGHQEVKVRVDGHEFTLRRTCDGRYEDEIYPLDSWSVAKGYASTGDWGKVLDGADFYTLRILKNGFPFNGNRISSPDGGEPTDAQNYYAGRSQPPTYFYQIRLLGEHFGPDVYTHPPYVKAMERLWRHFNPEPELLQRQPRGSFHAYRRGGISSDGLPFSVYGDDTNNGREYKDYIGRPESHLEDVETASEAAGRAKPKNRLRVFAEKLVHLQAAGEWGWDMSASRQAGGKDLSYINTTNVVPVELQCMLADAAEVLGHSYRLQRGQAEARGDMATARVLYRKELAIAENRAKRLQFVRTHQYNPVTKTYHDLELLGASASYDSLRSYRAVRQVRAVSASSLHALYSGVTTTGEEMLGVIGTVDKRLLGPGGLSATDTETGEQWDKPNAWASPDRVGACAPVHAAAQLAANGGDPGVVRELLAFSGQVRANSLYGSDAGYVQTGTIKETIHAFKPSSEAVAGEYPKDARNPNAPRNFAMQGEKIVELANLDPRAKFELLVPVAGRFVIANSRR